ncbi:MAG TPA: carbohydrate-binding protein, partial [Micromonosporaceae bacterium]
NGHQYAAKWWTQGDDPATHHGTDDVWIDNGTCTDGGATPPPTSPPPTTQPPTTPPPTTAAPTTPPPTGTQPWVANHAYTVGTLVTYAGHTYKCLQSHTSQVGWEPPNVPALWQLVS